MPHQHNLHFTFAAVKDLVPLLLETMTKQDEEYDLDEFNMSMAATVCLNLVASNVKQEIVPHVIEFIQTYIISSKWNVKEAAILALSTVLESPTHMILNIINSAVPVLLEIMKGTKESSVRDTAAWIIGRICKLHPEPIISQIEIILQHMIFATTQEPRVAANACWAIHNIAQLDQKQNPLYLSKFNEVLNSLIAASERKDSGEFNLRFSAYEALNVIIEYIPQNSNKVMELLLVHFLGKLETTFQQQGSTQIAETQELICGSIQIIINRLMDDIITYSDRIMRDMYHILTNQTGPLVAEEVFLTIGALVNIMDNSFDKYVNNDLIECLIVGMRNWQDHKSCKVCIGLVGDISRAVGKKILTFCDDIVRGLLDDVRTVDLDRTVKPVILSCFGDIAMAIKGDFIRYASFVFLILEQACQTVVSIPLDANDVDLLEYVCDFCIAILDSYSGIIHGVDDIKDQNIINLVTGQLNYVVPLLIYIAQNINLLKNDELEKAAIGCLGDLFQGLEEEKTKEIAKNNIIEQFIDSCTASNDEEVKKIGFWVSEMMPSF